MNVKSKLMQKNGYMATIMAIDFLSKEEGDRINTVAQLSEEYGTGRGTVQNALKLLQEYGAVSLEARGHLGTFISTIDYKKLMEIADIKTLLGVMPLPYSKAYEGLATGIYNTLNTSGVSAGLAFMRGAAKRVEALLEKRYDFAVISKLAAEYYINKEAEIEILCEFGDRTYVSEHIVMFSEAKTEITDGMRIGIDYSSIDQASLTEYLTLNKKVELVPLIYSQIFESMEKGRIDAAVWNNDDVIDKNSRFTFKNINSEAFQWKDTNAVVVVRKGSSSLNQLLRRFLAREEVLKLQEMVVKGEIIPNY